MVDIRVPFPNIDAKVVDPKTGLIQIAWLQFFRALWRRTGSASGNSDTDLEVISLFDDGGSDVSDADIEGIFSQILDEISQSAEQYEPLLFDDPQDPPIESLLGVISDESDALSTGPISTVAVGASPYSYTARYEGYLNITGGTVSQIAIIRGPTTLVTGLTAGIIPTSPGDIIQITHTGAPTTSFIPR